MMAHSYMYEGFKWRAGLTGRVNTMFPLCGYGLFAWHVASPGPNSLYQNKTAPSWCLLVGNGPYEKVGVRWNWRGKFWKVSKSRLCNIVAGAPDSHPGFSMMYANFWWDDRRSNMLITNRLLGEMPTTPCVGIPLCRSSRFCCTGSINFIVVIHLKLSKLIAQAMHVVFHLHHASRKIRSNRIQ